MQISKEEVFKVEVLSIKEFCEKHGEGVKPEAIYYAINQGLVDYIPLGREKFIVMSALTRQYVPNKHPTRKTVLKQKKKPVA